MTDKTLGAYQRHEKHDAAGPLEQAADRLIAVMRPDQAPVRECPDPEQHDNETTHPGGLSASEWKILAVSYGREMDSAREYAEETGEFAALWKEVARRAVRRLRTEQAHYDLSQAALETTMGRAITAERERDEALAGVRVLTRENIECHERFRAAESRPLTPDAITDEMVDRAWKAYTEGKDHVGILRAALTEPPARPEGAEEVDGLVEDWMATLDEDPDLGGADDRRSLADYLAARLADPTRKED